MRSGECSNRRPMDASVLLGTVRIGFPFVKTDLLRRNTLHLDDPGNGGG